ncbi:MAG: DUF4184 family protein [Actinomycetia bacterium]|nr:DUF4184 family protein [Actinomycetes bacterium]
MPVTFPAHQGLIAPVKLRWPNAIDATALCIGAAAPDLAFPFGTWLGSQSHTAIGLAVWSIPFTMVAAVVVRWRAASGIFAAMPDLGPLRLKSYRVLGRRRPRMAATLSSAVLGAGSHVLIDGFTHSRRFGAKSLSWDEVLFTIPIRGEFTAARVLQHLGHVVGSVSFVVVLAIIASSGRLERWYGADAVEADRRTRLSARQRRSFWIATALPALVAVGYVVLARRAGTFLPISVFTLSLLCAGATLGEILERGSSK